MELLVNLLKGTIIKSIFCRVERKPRKIVAQFPLCTASQFAMSSMQPNPCVNKELDKQHCTSLKSLVCSNFKSYTFPRSFKQGIFI